MNLTPSVIYNRTRIHLNLWWQGTLLLAVFLAISILLYLFDPRYLGDEKLWIKPIKFEISVILHFATLAVLASLISAGRREGRAWTGITYMVVGAGLFEVLYIFLQAARGRESHYNDATMLESVMYGLMGLGAVALVAGSFYLGYLLYREYRLQSDSVLLFSSAIGLMSGSVLTLLVAGYLSSFTTGYTADPSEVDAIRLPLFSWYLNGQDLRIPHFLATHMMQLLPLYGLWLARRQVPMAVGKTRVLWVAGVYTVLVALLFVAALIMSA